MTFFSFFFVNNINRFCEMIQTGNSRKPKYNGSARMCKGMGGIPSTAQGTGKLFLG